MALTQIQQDGLSSNAFQAISANTIALLPSLAGSGILIQANGQINSNVTLTLDTLSPFLTTSNVSEGSNLYYTNARVISAISGNVTVAALNVTNTTASTSKTTGAVTVAGGLGVASDIYAGTSVVVDNPDYGNVYLTQYGSIYARANGLNATSLMQVKGNDAGTAGMGMRAVTGSNSLIYSNSAIDFRVDSTIRDLNTPSGGATIATIASTGLAVTGNINAGNVIATVHQGTIWTGIYTANVIESSSNLYYTNVRVYANITAALAGNVTIGNLVVNAFTANSFTTTGNVTAGNVIANSAVFGSGAGGSVTGANLISATNIQGDIWIGLYTANIIESSSALYYTNTRVNSNVIAFLPSLAGSGIQIQANGQINNIVETLNPFLLAGM